MTPAIIIAAAVLLVGTPTPDASEPPALEASDEPTHTTDPIPPTVITLPPSRGGQNLIHQAFEGLHPDRWLRASDDLIKRATTADGGHVTLYRWWTDACPFCEASLPAIESLRKTYGPRGLDVVAVYHPKPIREVDDRALLDAANRIGYAGAIAVDTDWSELRRLYLDRHERRATSITIIVDGTGTIRFVHPGPVFFPASQRTATRPNADHDLIERAITALLPVATAEE